MAIDIPTELLTASSGSVGDVVFSRNQHGPYTRGRITPTDPASARQLVVRDALAECVTAWNATLSTAERRAWDAFALAVRTSTALGRSTHAGGLGMYVRANVPRIQAAVGGTPRVDQAPTQHDSASPTPIVRVVLNFIDDTLHPFFTDSDPWTTETGAALLIYASAPQPLTRHSWNGPYRLVGSLLGSDPTLSSPGTVNLDQPAAVNERVFVRGRLTRADARLSPDFRLPADPVPQVAPLPISAVISLAPPRPTLVVTFDALLRREPHAAFNWTVWHNFRKYRTLTVQTAGNQATLTLLDLRFEIHADVVEYTPPPNDVNGLLTGIPVATFFNFPVT